MEQQKSDRVVRSWMDFFVRCVEEDNPKLCEALGQPGLTAGRNGNPPNHVIPVYIEPLKAGAVIPMRFQTAEEWRISDAFGRFEAGISGSPQQGFAHLMRLLEGHFTRHAARPMPLRWRKAFDISLGCRVHLEMIDGRSLQLPLALAVVRELGRNARLGRLPLGDGPVFCTGEVTKDGYVGRVAHVREKAEGFLREYGPGWPAVLPTGNERDMTGLKSKFKRVRFISRVSDLLAIDPFLVKTLGAPPVLAELDSLLNVLRRMYLSRSSSDFQAMAEWLGAAEARWPEAYRYRLAVEKASALAHLGLGVEPLALLEKARHVSQMRPHCLRSHGCAECIGIEDKLRLGAVWVSVACNLGDCVEVEAYLASLEAELTGASATSLSEYWANRSRAAHFNGDLDTAVAFARRSVSCADRGAVAYAGQNRNFLCRMLLLRLAAGGNRGKDLAEAVRLLKQARIRYAPWAAPENHACFCDRLESHLAGLQGKPYVPLRQYEAERIGRPQLYSLFDCARNPANAMEHRERLAREILTRSPHPQPQGFEVLLYAIAEGYACALLNRPSQALETASQFCLLMQAKGHAAWQSRLGCLILAAKSVPSVDRMEALCRAVPQL